MNKNSMQKPQGSAGMIKASDQTINGKLGGNVQTGDDLRQTASGGGKAKGSM